MRPTLTSAASAMVRSDVPATPRSAMHAIAVSRIRSTMVESACGDELDPAASCMAETLPGRPPATADSVVLD
ncbi:Inositol-trisphosphate 3-kinase A [Mycolicibacterium canariasense]|uniref:Inositol-trisphosphate 3-kinase A n=1 Tax=Mycolicibacterium canariasense TaxID=228230 RepID=A0A100WCK2_MYCCR|nr:Inositol-trisphosphate 3-kinase A [Mycolicibacterium canariasense]